MFWHKSSHVPLTCAPGCVLICVLECPHFWGSALLAGFISGHPDVLGPALLAGIDLCPKLCPNLYFYLCGVCCNG